MTTAPHEVHGILNLFKPSEPTSMFVVNRVKRLTRQKGVGHGGTLDPIADGVLPICFGQATRIMEYLIDSPKKYRMTVHLGSSTDTYDSQGEVTQERDVSGVTRELLERTLQQFRGVIMQTPPMYSALKHKGRRLYELARSGVEVAREPRRVEMFNLEIISCTLPQVVIDAECGRGAYMRSLAHDIGEAMGVGAHLKALTRLSHGPFKSSEAIPVELVEKMAEEGTWERALMPLDIVLSDMRAVGLTRPQEKVLRNGQPVDLGAASHYAPHLESIRAYSPDGVFLAVLRLHKSEGVWKPHKVFRLTEPSPLAPVPGAA